MLSEPRNYLRITLLNHWISQQRGRRVDTLEHEEKQEEEEWGRMGRGRDLLVKINE